MFVAVLGACGGSSSSAKTVGELGNGEFRYTCVNPNDGACDTVGSAVFPGCVLLGGQFEMDYILHESDAVIDDDFDLFVFVESANQSFFAGQERYRADRVGRAAFLAREDEQVVDIIHLDIVEADGIEVKAQNGATVQAPVELPRGATTTLDVFASATGCHPLGGGGPVTASSQADDIATAQIVEGSVLVHAEEVGATKVTVGMAGFETEIDVVVTVGPARRKKPGEDESESDGGSEDESGSDSGGSEETAGTDDTGAGTDEGSSSGSEG
jgi:hypothetical protein